VYHGYRLGALKVGIASAYEGWGQALSGYRPTDLMLEYESVVVVAIKAGLKWYNTFDFGGMSVDVDGRTYRPIFLFA